MTPLLMAFHPDFGNGRSFAKRSELQRVASDLGMEFSAPSGDWVWGVARGWHDVDDAAGRPSDEVAKFYRLSEGRQVVLCGYSDGASVANYLATYRSEQVIAVVSYAGRLQRTAIDTARKFPILDVWNERDRRRDSRQRNAMAALYESHGHRVTRIVLPNGKTHWSGWDPAANDRVAKFIRLAQRGSHG